MERKHKNVAIYVAYEDHEPLDPSVPEKNLLRAILFSAMSDMKKKGDSGRKATQYLLDPDEEYIFSFRSICNLLDLDPHTILFVVGLAQHSEIEGVSKSAATSERALPE